MINALLLPILKLNVYATWVMFIFIVWSNLKKKSLKIY